MPTNTTIEDEIRTVLTLDPRIPDADAIAVSAEKGTITLRGTVGSFASAGRRGDAWKIDGATNPR